MAKSPPFSLDCQFRSDAGLDVRPVLSSGWSSAIFPQSSIILVRRVMTAKEELKEDDLLGRGIHCLFSTSKPMDFILDEYALNYPGPDRLRIAYSDGSILWWHLRTLDRPDGPAVLMKDGSCEWYHNGQLDRDEKDGPAVERQDGSKYYYKNDRLHRRTGPAEIKPNGACSWYLDGVLVCRTPATRAND